MKLHLWTREGVSTTSALELEESISLSLERIGDLLQVIEDTLSFKFGAIAWAIHCVALRVST